MQIRQAHSEDIPSIVTLLKQSLGESLLPKSEKYWIWKHVNNPFGASPVLVAFEDDMMIGVRALMRWKWTSGKDSLSAVRAVDTATHPDHQGKGIFKKLTLSLLDACKSSGDDFVFNTPNNSSKPGYIKMGWEEAGRLPVRVSLRPISMVKSIISPEKLLPKNGTDSLSYWLNHPGLESLTSRVNGSGKRIRTTLSPAYFRWRYQEVPIVNYEAFGCEKNGEVTGLIFGRIKLSRAGKEFRITDIVAGDGATEASITKQLKDFLRNNDIAYCTCSGFETVEAMRLIKGLSFLWPISRGPIVTVRRINFEEMARLKNFADWSPSLGDLELF